MVVADAYFSKATFTQGLDSVGFHLISRLRDDANLMYIHDGQPTGKKGRPKVYGDKIDFNNLDYTKIQEIQTSNEDGKLYRDAKQFKGLYHSQARDIRRLDFAFNTSFTAINAAKIMMKENSIPFSMEALKSLMFNSYLLDSFFKLSGVRPNRRIK